jgi:hypothetical protein
MSIVEQVDVAPTAQLIKWLAMGLGVVGLILPILTIGPHSDALAYAALATPLLTFTLMLMAPQAFAARARGARSLNVFPALPVMGLVVASFSAHLVDWTPALLPMALSLAIALLLGLGLAGGRWPVHTAFAALFLALFGAGYGYGGLVFADRALDRGASQTYSAEIERAYLSYGRSGSTPHFVLAPWGPMTAPTDVTVPRPAYNALSAGQSACVRLHPGYLHMPWFTAGLCDGV